MWLLLVVPALALPPCVEAAPRAEAGPRGTLGHTADLWLGFWQATISRADGSTCTLSPSCSAYAREAVRETGPVIGVLETAARLTRPHIPTGRELCMGADGRVRALDPLHLHRP
jgi:putative component of membrane protein insertase Oxa1/YidC/SpoIIIJ protein YidD